MKTSESKNRISSLFTSQTSSTPIIDQYKIELNQEMMKVEQELTQEFTQKYQKSLSDTQSLENDTKRLKKSLNLLKNKNKTKQDQIFKLKQLVDMLKPGKSIENSSSPQDLHARKLHLKNELSDIETISMTQYKEQEILNEMKTQEYENLKCMKEKLNKFITLQKIQDCQNEKGQLQKLFFEFSKFKVQKEIKDQKKKNSKQAEKHFDSLNSLKKTKSLQSQAISKSIKNISQANLTEKKTIEKVKVFKEILENNIVDSKIHVKNVSSCESKLSLIRESLSLISKSINSSHSFEEPLSSGNINLIISAYSRQKFQEISLGSRFQTLTEDQLDKQKKCDLMKEELQLLKSSESKSPPEHLQKLTFNQLKSFLSSKESTTFHLKFSETQQTILSVYTKILNITNHLKKSVESVLIQMKVFEKDEEILRSIEKLESLHHVSHSQHIKSIYGKRKCLTIVDQRRGLKLEESRRFAYKSTISLEKIKNLLHRNLDQSKHKASALELLGIDEIAELIKADVLACVFVESSDIDAKMIGFLSSPKAMMIELNKLAAVNFTAFLEVLLNVLLDLVAKVKLRISSGKREILTFFEENLPENCFKTESLKFSDFFEQLKMFYLRKRCEDIKIEENSLRVNTENSYHDKMNRSSGHHMHGSRFSKSTKASSKAGSLDFKFPATSSRFLKVLESERFSLRYSPSFQSGSYSSFSFK